MKSQLFVMMLWLLVSSFAEAQERTYHFKIGQVLEKYDIKTGTKGEKELIKDTYVFSLVTKVENNYVIWLLEFDKDLTYEGSKGSTLNASLYQDPAGKPIYFIVPSAIWDQYADEIFASRGVSFGIVNVPMKVRFENSNSKNPDRFLELDANVNLGLSAAAYWTKGKEQSWFTPVGITITQIRADSTTSEGYLAKTENRSGFSIFGGVVYQKGDYQIGLLLGADWATGDISKHWVYQGKPWLGVGIGIGLFQANNKPIKKN